MPRALPANSRAPGVLVFKVAIAASIDPIVDPLSLLGRRHRARSPVGGAARQHEESRRDRSGRNHG
jgi:hypothetical protein